MSSPFPTLAICLSYVYIVKVRITCAELKNLRRSHLYLLLSLSLLRVENQVTCLVFRLPKWQLFVTQHMVTEELIPIPSNHIVAKS
jgi:hypothetical protein